MHEIDRWEGEGGLVYDLTHREKLMRMLRQAGIRFEEDTFGEEGTDNDITVYPGNEERVYFSFTSDGFLSGINVFYS
ncbi:hypothetical protein SEA_LILMARTIN_176 [Streptomyces phage LilMartin]|nr:hypothetical protein SEA_LILMARTIN_176 [Streptomyces phage LilMartin]QNO12567.1 hypothetical protein SEA_MULCHMANSION_177 [Streptomyces phage MulchMansion]UVK61237.1 hypothetical protein SEA_ANGELA_178 [Streptomyces phage Angela]